MPSPSTLLRITAMMPEIALLSTLISSVSDASRTIWVPPWRSRPKFIGILINEYVANPIQHSKKSILFLNMFFIFEL